MSIFHLSVKVIGRSSGRSATGAAAYRAAERIVDERTGLIHDFTRKGGVEHAELILPSGDGAINRSAFWNSVELHHKRGDAVLSREVEVALPEELTTSQRRALAIEFARELVERYSVAADVAIHAPGRGGDVRNHHAHIMLSACRVGADNSLGKKAPELDPIYCQKHRLPNMADGARERWAEMTNLALERAGHTARVDHRSLEEQGIDRIPGYHMGPSLAGMARRGATSEVSIRVAAEVAERLQHAREAGELARELDKVNCAIIDTTGDLAAALRAREQMQEVSQLARAGVDAFRAQVDQRREQEHHRHEALQAFFAFKNEFLANEQAKRELMQHSVKEFGRQRAGADKPQQEKQRGHER